MPTLSGDSPICTVDDDLLGRRDFAGHLADQIRAAPRSEGFVIGLVGPWGSGKTSLLNLAVTQLETEFAIVRFEPWLFTGADQLLPRFFSELGAQLESTAAGT